MEHFAKPLIPASPIGQWGNPSVARSPGLLHPVLIKRRSSLCRVGAAAAVFTIRCFFIVAENDR